MSPAFAGLNHARSYPQLALWATICRQLRWLGVRFAGTGCNSWGWRLLPCCCLVAALPRCASGASLATRRLLEASRMIVNVFPEARDGTVAGALIEGDRLRLVDAG